MADGKISYRIIPPCSAEQDRLLPLLARCFPNAWWGKRKPGTPFPYAGTSFVAEADGAFIGHAAVMPMKVDSGDGEIVMAGGLASVGVDPNYRKHGIADRLCHMAESYFEQRNFVLLMLYTAFCRVYEKSGWRRYDNASPWTLRGGREQASPGGRTAAELSARDRELVMAACRGGASFPGKVIRCEGPRVEHSWAALFRRDDLRFYLSEHGYAICMGGILAEFQAPEPERRELLASALAGNKGELLVAVPRQCLAAIEAAQMGFSAGPGNGIDPFHGELPMLYDFGNRRFPAVRAAIAENRWFFSAIDKF